MRVTLRGYRVKPEFCQVSFEADFEKKTDKNLMDECYECRCRAGLFLDKTQDRR